MKFKIDDTFLLTHGSKRDFTRFDLDFVGSGEGGGPGFGLHFTDSIVGAVSHAEGHKKSNGEPIVYFCRIKDDPLILRRQTRISEHSAEVISQWNKLPCSCQNFIDNPNWYNMLDDSVYDLIHSQIDY